MNAANDMGRIKELNSVFAESILLSQLEAAIFSIKVKRLADFLEPSQRNADLMKLGIRVSEIDQDFWIARDCIAGLVKLGVAMPDELLESVTTLYKGDISDVEKWKEIVNRIDSIYKNDIAPLAKVL